MNQDEKLFQHLMTLDESDLLVETGKGLFEAEFSVAPIPDSVLVERVKRWIRRHAEELQLVICTKPAIQDVAQKGFSGELAMLVAGALESIVAGTAISPLAIYLCRRGLETLCSATWTHNP